MIFDMSELRKLAADLGGAGDRAQRGAASVVEKAAHNIKTDWRSNAAASNPSHAARYPYSIAYTKVGDLEVEIEPQDGSQGKFGAILEYGGVNNAPQHNGKRATEKEEPKFQAEIEKLGAKVLE